ncbi:MAG: DUF177 domain-containing protein [Bacteroidetes bacterium]|nr:DUF177 domain-containing protein [Bacteroidota bacterium]
MNYFNQFIIPVAGLKPGSHQIDLEIDDTFFEHFEYSEIRNGLVNVHLDAEKEETMVVFNFDFEGHVRIPCDRCYEPFDLDIRGNERLILKFGSDFHEESEDVQVVPVGENHFDISSFIYEYIILALPARRVHPENESGENLCNAEVIRLLNENAGPAETDPRWEKLAQLKKKKL